MGDDIYKIYFSFFFFFSLFVRPWEKILNYVLPFQNKKAEGAVKKFSNNQCFIWLIY